MVKDCVSSLRLRARIADNVDNRDKLGVGSGDATQRRCFTGSERCDQGANAFDPGIPVGCVCGDQLVGVSLPADAALEDEVEKSKLVVFMLDQLGRVRGV